MNVESSASIFYGLTVSAADLGAAGNAHVQIEPILVAIGLIKGRVQRGRLQTVAGAQAVQGVPVEVWDLIRRAAITEAVREARIEICRELFGRIYEEEVDEWVWDKAWMDGGPEGAQRRSSGIDFPWTSLVDSGEDKVSDSNPAWLVLLRPS